MKSLLFLVLFNVISSAPILALEELPLGTSKEEYIAKYGAPTAAINSMVGIKEKKVNPDTLSWPQLRPPRFYYFTNGISTGVHYSSLSNKNLTFVKELLAVHASGAPVIEIDPKTQGHDYPGRVVYAWKCPRKGWVALYREAYNDTAGSLLIVPASLKSR